MILIGWDVFAQEKRSKDYSILPFPTFGYEPETRFYLGAVALGTYKPADDSLRRLSTAGLEVTFTQNKQFIFTTGAEYYSDQNEHYLAGSFGFYDFPELFWGLGNNTVENAGILYDARRLEFEIKGGKRLVENLYTGPLITYNHMYRVRFHETTFKDRKIPGYEGSTSSGVGWSVWFDTRQNVLRPEKGDRVLRVAYRSFQKFAGSTHVFNRLTADGRAYLGVADHLFGFQVKSISTFGNPPFRMMALMGGGQVMRGYYYGRFRDNHLLAAQAEYRSPAWWRISGVLFGGGGAVAGTYGQLKPSSFKPTYGLGLRFLVSKQDRINLRFDYARGQNTDGFYIGFGEAF